MVEHESVKLFLITGSYNDVFGVLFIQQPGTAATRAINSSPAPFYRTDVTPPLLK